MRPNTDAEYAVLGLLAQAPRHGYAIARQLGPSAPLGQVWRLRRNEVYAILAKLEAQGWVQKEGPAQGPRRRAVFRLTPRGEAALREWLWRPVQGLRDMRLGLLGRLYFARILAPEEQGPLLQAQAAALGRRLAAWREAYDRAQDPFARSVFDFRAAMTEAALQWLQRYMSGGVHEPSTGPAAPAPAPRPDRLRR
ncbi:MAG TPA: PadR family transcriptional regulator [Dehalococcoidia bacterium]|nr:PadR family transcriptional regulator [Dehalococcoidia bacterium]